VPTRLAWQMNRGEIPLRDLRVRSARSSYGVRVDFRRSDAVGLRPSALRQDHADSSSKNGEKDAHHAAEPFHFAGALFPFSD
jgi:hypothetical protein